MKISVLSLLFLFTFSCVKVNAQSDYKWEEASANGYTYKYVTNDPMKARFYTLSNGLTVILTENHKEPRIAVNIAVRAGSNTDPKDHTGLAHYLEHLLFKGTDKFGTLNWEKEKPYLDSIKEMYERYTRLTDPEERKKAYHEIDRLSGEASKYSIANEYDKLMKNIGSNGTNAHTWYEETVYEENIPSNAIDKFLLVEAERFRNPVIRLFHTELEAVYEEKNRSLDNDRNKVQQVMMASLFPTHNYGQQTTIGTIEHLKNPSLKAIQAYYDEYYVPNNMAIIMAGDFDADQLIKKIDKHFSYMENSPFNPYNPAPEKPITSVIVKEVYGPSAASMMMAYRTPAANTHDALVLNLISNILSNGSAGLYDINLNKSQKVQGAGAGLQQNKDYGAFILYASPKENQTLEDLSPLLLNGINKIKAGDFDTSLLNAIVANTKLSLLQRIDNNGSRLGRLMDAFIKNQGKEWDENVAMIENMSKVTKAEVQAIANKYFHENYVIIYKRKGDDKNIVKVEKPSITPIETNAGKASPFVQEISAMKVKDIKPKWINYNKAITKAKAGIADVLYVQNKENDLFSLYYRFEMGNWNDPLLSYAAAYLQFLGTDKLSAEEISKAFYNIASDYRISVGNEVTTITISGLQENFGKAVSLFENIIANSRPNEEALATLKKRWLKARANNKLNKRNIANGLRSYAYFGKNNPFNTVISNEELNNLKSQDLVNKLHQLLNYKHTVIYFGPKPIKDFTVDIEKIHHLPQQFLSYPKKHDFEYVTQKKNTVLFADYDMVQSEISWIRNIKPFDFSDEATIKVFNNYFGGGMGSIVFQTIRESKALAYSTYAMYLIPGKKENPFTVTAYVGSQSDKMNTAVKAMNELLNKLPLSEQSLNLAKHAVKKDIQTQRIVDAGIIFSYLNAQEMGFDKDMRKAIYKKVDKISIKDLQQLHQSDLANKAYTYCIVGSEDRITTDELEKIGTVKKLSLEEIFGY